MNNNITGIDIDFKIIDNYYDIYLNSQGDIASTDSFNTAIKMSLLCERRANESEIAIPEYRRGWFGNTILGYNNFEIGSKLWLLDQARADFNTLNLAKTYTEDALQWFVDDKYLTDIKTFVRYDRNFKLIVDITFNRTNDKTETISYNLWNNTFLA